MTDRSPLPSGDPPPKGVHVWVPYSPYGAGTVLHCERCGASGLEPVSPHCPGEVRASLSSGSPGTTEKRVAELRDKISDGLALGSGEASLYKADEHTLNAARVALDELCSEASGSRRESSETQDVVPDLVSFVTRLARQVRSFDLDNRVARHAMEYLERELKFHEHSLRASSSRTASPTGELNEMVTRILERATEYADTAAIHANGELRELRWCELRDSVYALRDVARGASRTAEATRSDEQENAK